MLRDIKLEDKESHNLERFAYLINEQRKLTLNVPTAIEAESKDLEKLVLEALKKHQWRLLLLLLTSPCHLSQDCINLLAKNKHDIINAENLKARTAYGQYILGPSINDFDNNQSNLSRLARKRSGLLPTRKIGIFFKPIGALGKVYTEVKSREENKDDKIIQKNEQILENMIRCARMDGETVSYAGKRGIDVFNMLLTKFLTTKYFFDNYQPLLILFEVIALLMDKGFNKPLAHKNKNEVFRVLKMWMDSKDIPTGANGCYNYLYWIHIKYHSMDIELLGTVFHEFTHALCRIIYNNADTPYREELETLAENLKSFFAKNTVLESDPLNFNTLSYPKNEYAAELFPRIVELYLYNPYFCAAKVYPLEMALTLNRLFSHFIRDLVEFKDRLVELQAENKWSRVEISKALESKDYKLYFSMLRPENQSKINEWPQFSKDSKLTDMALSNGFSLLSIKKLKKNPLQFALTGVPDFQKALSILQKMWKEKLSVPSQININTQNLKGRTLLMEAIIQDYHPGFIQWLIETVSVDLSVVDNSGRSAKDYAKDKGLSVIEELIKLFSNPVDPRNSFSAVV